MRAKLGLLLLVASLGSPSHAAASPRSKARRATAAQADGPPDRTRPRDGPAPPPSPRPVPSTSPPPQADPAPPADAVQLRPVRVKITYDGPQQDERERHRWYEGFRFRLGGLYAVSTGSGTDRMTNLTGMSKLSSVDRGPVDSGTHLSEVLVPALIVSYAPPVLGRRLSIETILAPSVTQKITLSGKRAKESLSETAIGNVPTGMPPLGTEFGEVKALPPIVTAVYRFFPGARVRPYLGVGACAQLVLEERITNKVLTAVRQPTMHTPPALGWVAQAGAEVRFGLGALWPGRSVYLAADLKYIGLETTTTVKDIWVEVPGLPVYGVAKVGDLTAHTKVDPLVGFLGIGMDF